MKYSFKNYLFKLVIVNGINNINCEGLCNYSNGKDKLNNKNKINNNVNNNINTDINNDIDEDEKKLQAKREDLLSVLKTLKDENAKYDNIFDISITEDNIKESVYFCSNPDINIEIIENKFDKLKKIFEDKELCSKKKELVYLLNDLEEKNNKLEILLKISLDINKDKIINCKKDEISEYEEKLNKYKKNIEFILKISDSTYKIIDEVYSIVGKIKFKIVLKDDNYIYLYHNYNEFAKSVNEFKGDFKVENIKGIEFKIKNKEDILTFDKIISNIADNIATNCPLINILEGTYFLTLKFKDKDSYYKYDVSTNRDLVTNEKGYWFNYKNGNLGKYCYDSGTNQMGFVDEIDGNVIKLVGNNIRRQSNCIYQFLQGK